MKRLMTFLAMLAIAARGTETNTAAPPVFAVKSYEVEGNTVLPQARIDAVLTNYTGSAIGLDRLKAGLGALQLLYRNLGFVTVSVTLPQQKLTNGEVRVRVVEGKLARVRVVGNRYFSSNNVVAALPGLATNVLLNSRWFQPELDRANNNADRQIYPAVSPGAQPGMTDLTLRVKDRLPLHAHLEIDNKSTPGTPALRIDSAVQYNNLWQLNHQAGLEYDFSPQSAKSFSAMPEFYDQPQVASYSGFYRIPFGAGENLRASTENLPADFGYDQVTHQFRLPTPAGSSDLTLYASRSAAETSLDYGPVIAVTETPLSDISQQTTTRSVIYNEDAGAKFTWPLRQFAGIQSSLAVGADFKTFTPTTYQTNTSFFSYYSLDQFGNRVLVTNQVIPLGAVSSQRLVYAPLSIAWSASRPDPFGTTGFNITQSIFIAALASSRRDFQISTGAGRAGGDYGVTTAGLSREQPLGGQWSLLLRADGQWATAPLINNEQYALGGTAGVRGYAEGETYGDRGWRVMTDLRVPPIPVGQFPYFNENIPAHIRASVFMDYGQNMLLDRPGDYRLWGAGAGFYYTAGQRFDARLMLAWALNSGPVSGVGDTRAYFSMGFQF